MQGHSHVNMGTSPSTVDLNHQEKILEQLEDDMFYIFMIWNKSFKRTIKIYDLAKNILFEDADIDVKIADAGLGLNEFIGEAKDLVKSRTYQYQAPTQTTYSAYKPVTPIGAAATPAGGVAQTKEKPKTQVGAGWAGGQSAERARTSYGDYYDEMYDYPGWGR